MVYSGSQVTKGRARVVITSTAMGTEIGKIATALDSKAVRKESGFAAKWYKFKVALGLADNTPLQIKLNQLAYSLLAAAIVAAIIVVASTGFRDVPLTVATYAVASAVSVLPASLIAVVSLTLARASTDLAKRNALVRRMDAIEALAGVQNVCSDKTGTLTVGRMVVRKFWIPKSDSRPGESAPVNTANGQSYSFETGSDPFYPRGEVTADRKILTAGQSEVIDLKAAKRQPSTDEDSDSDDREYVVNHEEMEEGLRWMVQCASLCNQAVLNKPKEENSQWEANGDPTETALQVAAHKLGHGKPFLTHSKNPLQRMHSVASYHRPPVVGMDGHYEQIVEHPFDSTVKRMSIAFKFVPHSDSVEPYIFCFLKGAVERVFERCNTIYGEEFSEEKRTQVIAKMDILAAQGLRVLALCGKKVDISEEESIASMSRDDFEQNFGFLGLAGIFDPPRKESAGAVADCLRAGITPRMLTGDHPATATAIALSIGIIDKTYSKNLVMTGQQFDALSDDQVDALDELPLVVARCAPETKVRMVDAIHRRGQVSQLFGHG